MRTVKLSAIITVCSCVLLATGCNQELHDLRIQNNTQRELISSFESKLQIAQLELDKLNRQLEALHGKGDIEVETMEQKIAALEEDIAKKNELIESMQQRLLSGGAALPVELSTMLEDFAKEHKEMVAYDSSSGIVKFKSDLLFERASDNVSSHAIEAVKTLCGILNSEEGKKFDIIIAGHTDDIPIARPATRDKHPTNWHLSSHRAISVLQVMENSSIDPTRLSTRGFGEYRPVVPNGPNKTGNQQNRRVDIYIVPRGV